MSVLELGPGSRLAGLWLSLLLIAAACGGGESEPVAYDEEGGQVPSPAGAEPEGEALAPIARVETADAWMDLIAQRPSASWMRGGRLVVDFGHPASRKYLELGGGGVWSLAEVVEDRRAAVILGRSASIDIPVDGPNAPALHPTDADGTPGLALAITLRALAPKQSVTVLWGEQQLANLTISDAWARRTISLPPEVVNAGDNRLRLFFRRTAPRSSHPAVLTAQREGNEEPEFVAAAVQAVEVGPVDTIREGPIELQHPTVDVAVGGQSRVSIPRDSSLVYYFVPPSRSRLRLDIAGSGGIEVLASTDEDHRAGRAPAQLLQEPLRQTGRKLEADLSGFGDVPTRLELRVRGSGEGDAADLRQFDVIARRTVAVDRRPRRLRDVYVFALEGARPDDLFGARQKGPRLAAVERFVDTSLVFEQAHSLGAAAVPSHASWLSSVVPPGHLTTRGTYVAESRTMIPELLDRAGYFNVGLSSNGDVTPDRGLVQGIADHSTLPRTTTRTHDAEGIVARMLEQVKSRPRPHFMYAIMNDAQAPYDPPSELIGDLGLVPDGAPVQHRTHMWVGNVRLGNVEPTPEQLAYVRRLYFGELQVFDRALARFMEALDAEGQLDASIIVVMGVHGEEFLEHGGAGHGRTLFEESIHVPLAIRAPELLAAGRVDEPVDLLDLGPTLVDLLGIDAPIDWNGETLIGLIDDPTPPPRLLTAYLGDGSRAGIIGHHKLIVGRGRGVDSQQLYDLAEDPHEAQNLAGGSGVALRMIRVALAWEWPETPDWDRARWGTGANLRPAYALDHGM